MGEAEKDACNRSTQEAHNLFIQILQRTGGEDYRNTKDYLNNCKKLFSVRNSGGKQVEYNRITPDQEPSPPSKAGGAGEEEEVDVDFWDEVSRMRSDEVMTMEIEYCRRMMAENKGKEAETEWEVRMEEVENTQRMLGGAIEGGVLSLEGYVASVKAGMRRDAALAKMLKAQGREGDAKRVGAWAIKARDEIKAIQA
eukprot:CAMPEP_0172025776 /NCGR_PEP_ID=MMETSP1041-20130122/16078_1 /TAXON_ID=464988 /ORGANISM="Hemiselmis andersenii, Strain CCMP439" /LENGTH=196 /DNA_ID=CAMNT_0012681495 /DNA_START=1 /DNA_END=587 /DNA_ORIENTATION=-